ncbi:MAG TPA: hypothetical protein VF240_13280 [Pyrinomonadaceae bacterium]
MWKLALLLLISGVSVAQQTPTPPPGSQGPEDVAVVKFSWRKERVPGWENRQFSTSVESYDAMRARVDNERRIQQARNTGNKAELGRREDAARMLEDANSPKDLKNTGPPRDGYRYKVIVSNAGTKTVKLIDWDYVFLDPNTRQEISRRQFTSEEKVRPGKGKELEVFILSPPFLTVNAGAPRTGESPFVEQVILMRVEYSDGTIWQRP